MDPAHEWVVALARDVAPDEEELSSSMLDAYLAGGRARQELLEDTRGPTGGFDSSVVAMLMPVVFHATKLAAPAIGTLLVNKQIDYLLGCVKSSLSITEIALKGRKLFGLTKAIEQTPAQDGARAGGVKALMSAGEIICTELRARGLSEEQSDAITYRVLIRLLEDPSSADAVVKRLAVSK
jgi:hypothetical protein